MTLTREELEDCLSIDRNNLDEDLISHPELLYSVSNAYALAISKRDKAKDLLKHLERTLPVTIQESSEQKLTVKELEGRVSDNKEFIQAQKQYRKMSLSADRWGALKEAYIGRGYALREVCQLEVARHYSPDQVTPRERMQKEREKHGRNS